MTPWRYALTLAVGLTPPASLMKDLPAQYDYVTATAPMVGLGPARRCLGPGGGRAFCRLGDGRPLQPDLQQ
jgi:hypothetical protein